MSVLRFSILAICLLCFGCSEQEDKDLSTVYPTIILTENQYRTGDSLWYVCYGSCFEDSVWELTFVVFEEGSISSCVPPGERRVVSRTLSRKQGSKTIPIKHEAWLIDDYFSQKMIQLPTQTQLYEVRDRQLVTSEQKVTMEQLKRFLDSQPEQYTIEALLSSVKESDSID